MKIIKKRFVFYQLNICNNNTTCIDTVEGVIISITHDNIRNDIYNDNNYSIIIL
jgi:hypothetical protein